MRLQLMLNVMRRIRGRMHLLLVLLLLACSIDAPAPALKVGEWSRAERVVLYSPHFDLQPEPYGGLNCPPQPLRLYGFETHSRHAVSALLVRVVGPQDALLDRAPMPVRDVPIRLSRRWLNGRFTDLPESAAWLVRTDAAGSALLRVPAGVYELAVLAGWPLGRGIIQLRPGFHDSLQVHLRPGAVC